MLLADLAQSRDPGPQSSLPSGVSAPFAKDAQDDAPEGMAQGLLQTIEVWPSWCCGPLAQLGKSAAVNH